MRTELFMYFCIKKYIGTQGEVCRQLKIFLNPPVVYVTDRSNAVVPVLFLFCVALWFILRGASFFTLCFVASFARPAKQVDSKLRSSFERRSLEGRE